MITVSLLFQFLITFASAGEVHEHGVAHLDIGMDGNKGTLTLDVDSGAINGKETSPSNEAELTKESQITDAFVQEFPTLLQIKDRGCVISNVKAKIRHHREGKTEHSDFEVRAAVQCQKPIQGAQLTTQLFRKYKAIQKIETQVVGDDLQVGGTLTPRQPELVLK